MGEMPIYANYPFSDSVILNQDTGRSHITSTRAETGTAELIYLQNGCKYFWST